MKDDLKITKNEPTKQELGSALLWRFIEALGNIVLGLLAIVAGILGAIAGLFGGGDH